MKDFNGKTVVITGGATGIGFALAKAFGKEGAKLVIASRRDIQVAKAVDDLKTMGYDVHGTTCDVSNYADVEKLADFAWQTYGRADVLINNAGVSQSQADVIDTDLETTRQVFNVNYFGVVNGIHVFGQRFRAEGKPCAIYTVGSENSIFNGVPKLYAYVSAKHALCGLMTALREEAPDFMDVSLLLPGFVTSEMSSAMSGGMPADDYANMVLPQLKENNFYVVSHSAGAARVHAVWNEIGEAFTQYAPRFDGDEKWDVRRIAAQSAKPLVREV